MEGRSLKLQYLMKSPETVANEMNTILNWLIIVVTQCRELKHTTEVMKCVRCLFMFKKDVLELENLQMEENCSVSSIRFTRYYSQCSGNVIGGQCLKLQEFEQQIRYLFDLLYLVYIKGMA